MKKQRWFRLMLVVASVGGAAVGGLLLAGSTTRAQPPSPAAVARLAANRGKVVGAPCEYRDGYVADYTALQAKADLTPRPASGVRPPVNLMAFADARTRPPLQTYELPPGRAYCLKGLDNPEGYLTMNCRTNADCPAPASCQDSVCRAACSQDTDCGSGSVCAKPFRPGAVRYCRCEDCARKLPLRVDRNGAKAAAGSGPAPAKSVRKGPNKVGK